jgi:hypothetical protein
VWRQCECDAAPAQSRRSRQRAKFFEVLDVFEYSGLKIRFDSGSIRNSGLATRTDEFGMGRKARKTFFDVLERARFLKC